MSKTPWTPWHDVVQIREDLRSGELSLASFAADLNDVVMGNARRVYQVPEEFFALTYPTFNLRELAKDVLLRLAGKSEKAVRQLELTYGGGKTHTLITLYHLTRDPATLPDLPAVKEFVEHAGITPPKARIAVLPFDKLDVEKGMEVRAPGGETRWLKHPWSVLAWQIAGVDGLRLLHPEGQDAERESSPAENLLNTLLSLPAKDGLSTLVLLDEVLMYAREKVILDEGWRGRLQNFFQYLTQAVTKTDRCAMVVSLLASDPRKSDTLGKEIAKELYDVFRRETEEGIQPVVKEDVAEVLRRRFFTPDSIRDRESFRPHVVAALKGISDLDDLTKKDAKAAEERFLRSYPFHPDVTEVFYAKWTQLEGFQRTRGVLRTYALALREAEKWDDAPLIAANVFLNAPGKVEVSEAARELATIAATEEYEGKRQDWTGILEGELEKARAVQDELPGLKHREIEQAVLATFLHSQPIGQKALTRELLMLLGPTRPDKIELEKGLRRWTELSWFLDEQGITDIHGDPSAAGPLPKSWRLGSKPNLHQMHNDARQRVSPSMVEARLLEDIAGTKSLTAGAGGAGARVHNLPDKPKDIEDDGEFHYAVLGPKAASASGNPSAEVRRFLDETTEANRPRVNRNAVVLAVPSRDGLDLARDRVKDYLAWEEVRAMLKGQDIDPVRAGLLTGYVEDARKKIPEAIRQAYCIVVTVSAANEVEAFKVTVGNDPLFTTIKADQRSRIQDTPISPEALLPNGPYDLWREGETSRWAKDLVGAFAQSPALPKMLRRKAILDTLALGVREGLFVLRLKRPDGSIRTIWREEPTDADFKESGLEVVLPEAALLTSLPYGLLLPGVLPGLWPEAPAAPEIRFADIASYFGGGKIISVQRDGYEEPISIPKVERPVLEGALSEAVQTGKLWLTSGPASVLAEAIPAGLLTDEARLQPPPAPVSLPDVLPDKLPEIWASGVTTAAAIAVALSSKAGKTLPWVTVRAALDAAIHSRILETTTDSGTWPCDWAGAQHVKLRVPVAAPSAAPKVIDQPPVVKPGVRAGEAVLQVGEFQDLADAVGGLFEAAAGYELRLAVRVELASKGKGEVPREVVDKVNVVLEKAGGKIKLQ